jgi:hypothetical protein
MPSASHTIFDPMMPHVVTVQTKTGTDSYSKPTYSVTVLGPWKALVINKIKLVRTAEEQLVTTTTAYVNTDGVMIGPDDKITLPDQFGGSTRKVAGIITWPDSHDGTVHSVEVNFL